MNLADLVFLSDADFSLRLIVEDYVKKGNPIVIDGDTLARYPTENVPPINRLSYWYWGIISTNVVLITVHELEIFSLLKHFKKILELTLIRVDVSGDVLAGLPKTPRKLTVINCRMPGLNSAIHEMKNLQSLNLERTDRQIFSKPLPKIKTLKLVMQGMEPNFPNLEQLTVDTCWRGITYKSVQEFKKLKHLKVLVPVGYKQKEEIQSLNLKSTDFYCYEIPKERNLILRLNDDCLMHIQSYLTDRDIVYFHEAHFRFSNLSIPRFVLDNNFLNRRPFQSNLQYYTRIGALVTNLDLLCDGTPYLRNLIALFTNVKEVSIPSNQNKQLRPIIHHLHSIGPGIEHLKLGYVYVENKYDMESIFHTLAPTLKSLIFTSNSVTAAIAGLPTLRNIQKFSGQNFAIAEVFLFLKYNCNHMQELDLGIKETEKKLAPEVHKELLLLICQMKKLKSLTLNWLLEEFPNVPNNSLPMLEVLKLSHCDGNSNEQMNKFLLCLDGTRLRSFSRPQGRFTFARAVYDKMTNIESMAIPISDKEEILDVISGLPKLTALITCKISDVYTLQEVRAYLLESNRKLTWNRIKIV